MEQTALNRGKLIKWTKGFTNKGAEGSDVSVLLEEALNKLGMKVQYRETSVELMQWCELRGSAN